MKKVWNNFLELKTSPTFMLVALIGLVDFFVFLLCTFLLIAFNDILPSIIWTLSIFVYFFYGKFRPIVCKYTLIAIPILYSIEFIFKIKLENNMTKNSKKYTEYWLLGIIIYIAATIVCVYWPIVLGG